MPLPFYNKYPERRKLLIEKMGGKCIRCEHADYRVLQIDHVHGNGAAERKERGIAFANSYAEIERTLQRARRGELQLLCANCNLLKRIENNENRRPCKCAGCCSTR